MAVYYPNGVWPVPFVICSPSDMLNCYPVGPQMRELKKGLNGALKGLGSRSALKWFRLCGGERRCRWLRAEGAPVWEEKGRESPAPVEGGISVSAGISQEGPMKSEGASPTLVRCQSHRRCDLLFFLPQTLGAPPPRIAYDHGSGFPPSCSSRQEGFAQFSPSG